MRQTIFTLLLACAWSLLCYAQTPYDSFAPEAYRPMLELEEPNQQPETIFSVVVADLENRMLLLMNVQNGEILAAISLSDDVSKSSEKGILVQTYLAPIMPILDVSPFSVFLNSNSYSIFINSLEK